MTHTIQISEQLYATLRHQAARSNQAVNTLVENWLKQHLDLERYPELVWRHGPGGWRMGIKGTAMDVYTIVGYSQAGYSPQEIVTDLLPRLSLDQVRAALRYYAEYPDEIDRTLAESQVETVKAGLYRALGAADYYRLTGLSSPPPAIRETGTEFNGDSKNTNEHD